MIYVDRFSSWANLKKNDNRRLVAGLSTDLALTAECVNIWGFSKRRIGVEQGRMYGTHKEDRSHRSIGIF